MRAKIFTILITAFFISSILVTTTLIMNGYGLPSSYYSSYILDSYNVLAGISKEEGKPIIYEWDMVALLRPGDTKIVVWAGTAAGITRLGNVSITITIMGKTYSSSGPLLNISIHRDTIFFVARIRLQISNPNIVRSVPMVSVSLRVNR